MSRDRRPGGAGAGALDRRAFLRALPVAALGGSALAVPRAARAVSDRRDPWGDERPPLETIGVQLYTVRDRMSEDVEGTLGRVAAVGYREVEFAGLYGRAPSDVRATLDAHGLRGVSSHHSLAEVRGAWERTIEAAVTLGQELIVVPSIPQPERTAEGLRRIADDFDRAAATARSAGLRFGYHNHAWELEPLPDGVRPMDLLLERTDPSLVDWQMDIFWTVHGGADPARYLREHAGRVTSVHVKDRSRDGRMVDVGAGVIDFATLLPLAERLGLRHVFVEHDSPDDSLASIRRSYEHLSALAGAS